MITQIGQKKGRMFKTSANLGTAIGGTTYDLWEINPDPENPIVIRSLLIGFRNESYFQEQLCTIDFIEGHASGGSGTIATTPRTVPFNSNNGGIGTLSIKAGSTTIASGGSPITIITDVMNSLRPYKIQFDRGEEWIIDSGVNVIRFLAPTYNVEDFYSTLIFEILG